MADAKQRIAFLDWIRGLACIGMFEWHGYDSWLSESARHGKFFRLVQLGGTLPAPIFLFSSGLSLALVVGRALQKGATAAHAGRSAIRRGAEIFGFALLFRVQEFLLGQPSAPWTDLLRVDILNVIGIAIMLMGLACWVAGLRTSDAGKIAERGDAMPRALPRRRYVISVCGNRGGDCAGHAAALDHAPAALAALASGVVHKRRAQPGRAAALAFPHLSVGGVCVRGTRGGIPALLALGSRA